jgi:cation diffusion facilitator family transporter
LLEGTKEVAMEEHHNHPHDQQHGHVIEPAHAHPHAREGQGLAGRLKHALTPHSHDYQAAALDAALATDRGIWAVKISLVILLLTGAFQVAVVLASGSVALLADTIHNFSDALTAVPLGLAFTLSRRARNTRFTYGYGRAEDIAGVVIVIMILASSAEAIYQSIMKLIHPQPISNLLWVGVAALVGFLGNELVALLRIRTGRQIGSAALVADGNHARIDGFTSLAVLAGAIGVWAGVPLLDPLVGLGIGVVILFIVWDSAREIAYRVMDAVDPAVPALIASAAQQTPGVLDVHDVAVRWVGHRQRTEFHITVDCQISTCASHQIAEGLRHHLFHLMPALVDATVHVDPCQCGLCGDPHQAAHHIQGMAGG